MEQEITSYCKLLVFEFNFFFCFVRKLLTKIEKSALSVLKATSKKRFAKDEPPDAGETQHSPPHFN